MPDIIHTVSTKRELKQFIHLPEKIYSHTNWVPPLYLDEWNLRDPRQNKALLYSEIIHFLAMDGTKPIGRIMGIINHKHNEKANEKTVRFFQLDAIADTTVVHALLKSVEDWGRSKGMIKMIGPYGFSDKDPQGFQIEGFEHLPVIGTPTNPSYLPNMLDSSFGKEVDCVSYSFQVPTEFPSAYQKIFNRIDAVHRFQIIEFSRKKELKKFILPVLDLVNESYKPLFGFVPMTSEEMLKLARQYMPVLDPELVKLIVNEKKELVAFVIAMPDLSKGLQQAKGRLLPFGFWHILKAAKKTHQLNLMLGAIKPGFRGAGLNVMLAKALFATASKRGFTVVDSHLILETNHLMRAECERLGGKLYKRYRVYGKAIQLV